VPKSKWRQAYEDAEELLGEPGTWDGITPRTLKEIRVRNRQMRRSGVRTQSSLDSLSSLMQLIKKLPNEKQKSIIEQLKAARKKPGGSPDAAIEDLPF